MSARKLEVGLLGYKVIGWGCGLFFLGASVGAFMARQYGLIAVLVFFMLIGAYMIVGAGSYSLDQYGVSHKSIFGFFRIRWNDVRRVEVGTLGTYVLHGD